MKNRIFQFLAVLGAVLISVISCSVFSDTGGGTYLVFSPNSRAADGRTERLTNITLSGSHRGASEQTLGHWQTWQDAGGARIEVDAGEWNFTLSATLGETEYTAETALNVEAGKENALSFTFRKAEVATYTITIADGIEHGTVTASAEIAAAGTEITLTATAEKWYELDSYSVKDADGIAVSVTDGKFTMPAGNVTVSAEFVTAVPGGFVAVKGATVSGAVSGSSVFIDGRTVEIPDMYVCDHEVTQSEYETYCKYGSSSPSDTYGKGDNYPAYFVNWYDALVYCNLRSMAENLTPVYSISGETDPTKWTGIVSESEKYCGPSSSNTTWDGATCDWTANGYRLPTEAEWEYIARGGNGGIPETQYTYSGSDTIDDVAWYDGNKSDKCHEVKTKNANSLGIYDMSGNVWEWCYDWKGNISISTDASGVASGSERVKRGGYWGNQANACSVSFQNGCVPYDRTYSQKADFGFRVVRTAN